LEALDATVIWRMGHERWGVENHAFNEPTQHYHLTHCPRHEATAIQNWLLILVEGRPTIFARNSASFKVTTFALPICRRPAWFFSNKIHGGKKTKLMSLP
jgi:hypothetical protein